MRKRVGGRRCLSFLLSLVLTLSLLPAGAFAADDVARVNGKNYTSIKDAWSAVKNGGTIDLLADWNLEKTIKNCLNVEKNATVTVNLNGHIIDRGLAKTSYYGYGEGQVFYVKDGASLTVNGGESTSHAGYLDGHLWFPGTKNGKTAMQLTGGILTGGACDDSDGAGAITMRKNTLVTLNNVTVAGNYADCYGALYGHGGAIRMHDSGSTLNLNSSKIMYNHAEDCGGGIYIADDNCTVNMNASEISHNFASDDGGGIYSNDLKTVISMKNNSKIEYNKADAGGGIYFNYTQCILKSEDATGSISHNTANKGSSMKGGGVYIEHNRTLLFLGNSNTGIISGITFDGNTASNYGGAIYIGQESTAVSGCKLINNKADYGGGIYNNNDKNTISNTTIIGNVAFKAGGGVFSSAMNDIALSGKVIIENNSRSGDINGDDLYLNDTWTTTAYLVGSPSGQSHIGIRSETPKERKLGKDQEFYFEDAFFYNGTGYHIEFDESKAELWLKSGSKPEAPEATEVRPGATDIRETYNGQAIKKGYFSYPSVVETTLDLDATYFYSDGYFLNGNDGNNGDPTVYNEHLATMSMAMAMSGFYSNIGNDGSKKDSSDDRTYTYKSQNIERLLTEIGVAADDIYISDSNTVKPGTDTIGVAIGQKMISDSNYILVPIAVRGAGYESEWCSNTTVGESGEHAGFASAADQVFEQVQNYIRDYGLTDAVNEGRVKFWIAGYSRAGATSNLTAKRLIEAYCYDANKTGASNQVYAYCFEAPKGGLNSAMKLGEDAYYCIHNCINKADAVPLVAPEEMGFIRYGVDHYVPGGNADTYGPASLSTESVWSYVSGQSWVTKYKTWYDNISCTVGSDDYNTQREKMLEQLKAVDPTNIYFYDKFQMAEINYITGGAGLTDMISSIYTEDTITQEQFARILVRALQAWGFYRSYDRDFRDGYSNAPSFEDALQTVTKILFSKSSDELNGMIEGASGALDRMGLLDLVDIWDKMIGDWTSLSQSERDSYLQYLWNVVMTESSAGSKPVVSYLTSSEKAELRSVWNVLLDVLLRFVEVDYNTNASEWNSSKTPVKNANGKYVTTNILDGIVAEGKRYFYWTNAGAYTEYSQVILGTLAKNATALMQAHYPEINLAWLRSYDSFYANETRQVEIRTDTTPTVTGTVLGDASASDNTYEGTRTLKLSTTQTGAGIYYRIKVNTGDYSDWRPYNRPISLEERGVSVTYTVQITAVYCGKTTEVQTAKYVIKNTPTYWVRVNDEEIGRFKEGDLVTIDGTPTGENAAGKVFKEWNYAHVAGHEDDATFLTKLKEFGIVASFTMPGGNVVVEAGYIDRTDSVTLTVAAPVAGESLPMTGTLTWGKNSSKTVSVYWLEQVNGGTQLASGTAKYGTKYSVAALIDPDLQKDLVFADNLDTSKVQVVYVSSNAAAYTVYAEDAANDVDPSDAAYKADVNAAGALRIFGNQVETEKANVTSVPNYVVKIAKDSVSDITALKACLPKTVMVETNAGNKMLPLIYNDNELSAALAATKQDAGATAGLNPAIDYDGSNLSYAEGKQTTYVHIVIYANGEVAAPTATLESGIYTSNQLVEISSATDDAFVTGTVTKAVDGGPETQEEFSNNMMLTGEEGKTVVYTVTAKAQAGGKESSPEVTFTYVIAIPLPTYTVTILGRDTGMTDSEGKHWSKTWQYTYTKGDKVTIAAPSESGELFEKWEFTDNSGITIETGHETDTALTVNSISGNITLTAVYNPVVKQLDLTMDAPAAGAALAEKIKSAAATVTATYPISTDLFDVAWVANDSNASFNTAYTAKLTLKGDSGMKFFLSENLKLNVPGASTATVVKEDSGYAIYVTFPATDKVALVSVAQPDNGYATRDQAAGTGSLPNKTTLTLSDGSKREATISWTVTGYNSNDLEAQTLTATGTVTLPDDVNANGVNLVVSAKVFVEAAPQAATPTASLSSGSYTGAQTLRLSCDTEGATIYYTLDGSDPTTSSKKYDGGVIELPNTTRVTELRAIAVKSGLRQSMTTLYQYSVKDDTPVTPGKPSTKPTEEPKDYQSCDRGENCSLRRFTDLDANAWYHDGIHYCLSSSLMSGYGDGLFGPNDSVSRAQLVTVLWRMAGSPEAETDIRFTDAPKGTWYADAVLWAAENGVVTGYGDGLFGPNDAITREQLAAMFYRFAKLQGYDMSVGEDTDILSYNDARSVSDWAMTAMQWACGAGLVNGAEGSLMPQGTATRAQTAAILQRLAALSK